MAADSKAIETNLVTMGPTEGLASQGGFSASVVDVGFNSTKLSNYHVTDRTNFRLTSQEDAKVKLGEELDGTGFLGTVPMERALRTLRIFREIVELEPSRYVLPVATSAVREAANREEFLRMADEQAGFKFRVLSEEEEALVSYFGASLSLRMPDAVFFDLGGGTLQVISSENFRVRKTLSLPLGARRLTYLYGREDGSFTRKGYERMKKHILELLPSRKELRLTAHTKLVGIGGTVRGMVRYYQDEVGYPFDKMHNFPMDYEEVGWTANRFLKMSKGQLKSLHSIGSGRAETMVAGTCVVRSLMKSLGAKELIASTHGLREGTLALFLQDHRWFQSRLVDAAVVDKHLASPARPWTSNWERNASALYTAELIDGTEYSLLAQARALAANCASTVDLSSVFQQLMSVDSPLSHADQVRLSIAIVGTSSDSYADLLMDKYAGLLKRKDKKAIRKISAAFELLELLERTSAGLKVSLKRGPVELQISQSGTIPKELLARAMHRFGEELELSMDYTIKEEKQDALTELRR